MELDPRLLVGQPFNRLLAKEGEERQPEQQPNLRNRKKDGTCYSAGIIRNGHLTTIQCLGARKHCHRRGATVKCIWKTASHSFNTVSSTFAHCHLLFPDLER